jgi:predicted signal transduction protein with EAL and GGDEF domain
LRFFLRICPSQQSRVKRRLTKLAQTQIVGLLEDRRAFRSPSARVGGDEFAVVQVGIKEASEAAVLTRRLAKAVGEPYEIAGHTGWLNAEAGLELLCKRALREAEDVHVDAVATKGMAARS